MKKELIIATLMGTTLLNAQMYQSVGVHTAETKRDACSKALTYAKQDALEQAGTLVLSQDHSSQGEVDGETHKAVWQKLSTVALGVAKLENKNEEVSGPQDRSSTTCKVTAAFSIDQEQMEGELQKILDKQEQEDLIAGYFEAEGYSEEGQSRYRALTAAKVIAQRNLLEIITGADLTSLTKVEEGQLSSEKVGSLVSGALRGAKIIKQEYDKETRSAVVIMRVSKADVAKAINEAL